MRRLQVGLGAFLLLVLVPALAFAQAAITGVVKDASGGVLPGVTVEASSPALIEKTRSAVTDGTGTYRIVDLRPGTYSVSFTLTGFSTVKRDGVELTGSFTANINADLKVGALEETITVSGETPIVDTQSVRRQVTVSNDVISSMPAARSYAGVMMLIPATTTQAGANLDIQVTPGMLVFGGAGVRTNEARIQVDGLNTGAAFNGVGGPIKKDKVWYFLQFRDEGSHRTIPGMFANQNMGNPNAWTYVADTSRPAVAAGSWRNGSARLTFQPTSRQKINVFWDQQLPCQGAGVLGSKEGCRQSGDGEIICGAAGASNPPCSATTA